MMKILPIFCALGFILFPSASYAQNIDDAQICRAGIATIMNRDLADVVFYREVKQVKYISYKREEDGVVWKFKCRIEDSRILWATEMGRWRNRVLDSIVEYKIKDDFLIIREKYNSGSIFNKRFNLQDLISKKK